MGPVTRPQPASARAAALAAQPQRHEALALRRLDQQQRARPVLPAQRLQPGHHLLRRAHPLLLHLDDHVAGAQLALGSRAVGGNFHDDHATLLWLQAEALPRLGRDRADPQAEAAAIRARGEAEAETLRLRAEAFERYGQAATTQMVVEVLPQMARELAAPIAAITDLTVISKDGAGQLSRSVADNLQETLEVVRRTTGVDVQALLSRGGANGRAPRSDAAAEQRPSPA